MPESMDGSASKDDGSQTKDGSQSKTPFVQQPGNEIVSPLPLDDDGGLNLIGRPVDESALDRLMREEDSTAGRLILNEEERRKVINDKVRKQVSFELKQARKELRENPSLAIDRLKAMMGVLDNSTDLFPENRRELRNRLESALLSSRQRKLDFDQQEAQRRLSQATALARQRELNELTRREEQLTRLINRMNSLLDEQNYEAARAVTRQAREIDQNEPAAVVAADTAELAAATVQYRDFLEEKRRNFSASFFEVRKASIPFPANPLLVFPEAEEWKRKKLRRAKYNSLRLTGSDNDERILRALEQPANFDYDEVEWTDVEQDLESKFRINIVLTQSARDDSLDEDEPVTSTLRGIRLKNALRLMLKEKNATFIVKDEVLQIVSIDDAETDPNFLVTNVYNVGDLVAPRSNAGGGLGGIGGGIGGGGGLGGGGGFGGGGGGFGGGGGGRGGGGGGVFCVQESSLVLIKSNGDATSKPAPVSPKVGVEPEVQILTLPANANGVTATTWSDYFENVFANPKSVKLTVREMMQEKKTDEIVSLILGAVEHDQRQNWMYEALTLAMQIAERPRSEVERALMSAVDLSSDVNDMLYAAHYMANHGMESRAIGLCEDIARNYPTQTEPVLMALRAANRIEHTDGIRWATVGVFSHEWPEHPEIVDEARRSADALRLRLQESGDVDLLNQFEQELKLAKRRDSFAKVSWTGDADLDVSVQEPGGTICSRLKPRTLGGGVMLGDEFSTGDASGEMAEYYILPKGFSGEYKLHVRRVWGEVTSGKVTVEIYSNYNSPDQIGEVRQIELGDPGFSVVFNIENGRRTESLEAHAIATVVEEQVEATRNILAQQIDGIGSGSTIGGFDDDVLDINRLLIGRNRVSRPVGYMPIVQQFFTGSFLTVNHATTADRLYVLVSPSPTFSQITDVFTFNTTAGAAEAQGGGQNGGGATGGIGGGGGAPF